MKLLIVDDNADMRSMLRNVCSDLFEEIYGCSDGDEAINLYERKLPDWVLMDIKMERMDGLAATAHITKNYPGAKVIIVSQYKDKAFFDAAMRAGAVEYVVKEDLLKIEEIINEYKNNQ